MLKTNPEMNRRKKALWWSLGGAALLLSAASPALYPQLKTWRAEKLVRRAAQSIARGSLQEAFKDAQAALQLQPQNTSALRLMARLLTAAQPAQAIPVWKALLEHPGATIQDRVEWIHYSIRISRLDLSASAVSGLLAMPSVPTQGLGVAAAYFHAAGARDRAIRHAMEALQRTPEDPSLLLLVCRILIDSESRRERLQALDMLASLAHRKDQQGLEAIELAAAQAEVSGDLLRELPRLLRDHPLRSARTELVESDIAIRLHPESAEETANRLIQLAARDPALKLEVARWCNRHRLHAATARLAEASGSIQDKDLYLSYLDALGAKNQWTKIRELLGHPGIPLEPALVALFKSRCARELGEERMVGLHFDQALSLASDKPALLWYFYQYFEKLGERSFARAALQTLKRVSENPKPAYVALVRMAESEKDTAKLLRLMSEIAERFPSDPEPRNDLAYLNLLMGKNIEQAGKSAEELVASRPEVLAFRTTLALAWLRRSDPGKAAMLYSGIKIDWNQVLPGWKAVYASVLGMNGRSAEAKALVREIPLERLKLEERLLIQKWMEPGQSTD